MSSGESRESVGEVNSDVSSGSDGDVGLTEDDPPIIRISRGIMLLERMGKLMLQYEVPFDYIYRILSNDEYIFGPGPLEIAICEETF